MLLLYDGNCALCDGAVRSVMASDQAGRVRCESLQGEHGRGVVARHPWLRGVDSLVLVEFGADGTETVRVRSAAVIALGAALGGRWGIAARLLSPVPARLRDAVYRGVAAVRHRVWRRKVV